MLLAGQPRRTSAGRATILAVTHVVASAAHAVGCVVLAEPRTVEADGTGLALRADPSPTSLLGIGNGRADPVEGNFRHLAVIATRARFGEGRLAGFARLVAATLDTFPHDFGGRVEAVSNT